MSPRFWRLLYRILSPRSEYKYRQRPLLTGLGVRTSGFLQHISCGGRYLKLGLGNRNNFGIQRIRFQR